MCSSDLMQIRHAVVHQRPEGLLSDYAAVAAADPLTAAFIAAPRPVRGGAVTLLYPKWIPGKHWGAGRIDSLAGLIVTANGKRLEWVRDPVDVFAFHVNTPAGTSALDVEFQFLTSATGNEDRVVMTPEMMNVQWFSLSLYPAGYFTRDIPITASITLPEGWKYATALETASTSGATATFKTVPYETLLDSPMDAGLYSKVIDLEAPGPAPVRLDVFADRPELLEAKPEHVAALKALVQQA